MSVARIRKKNNATVIDRRYKEEMFRGTFTALVTPFRNGDVDLAAFEKLIEAQIAAGISGVVAVGTTGESPTLTHEEKEKVIQRTVKVVNGRCKVLAGTGTNSTRDAIDAQSSPPRKPASMVRCWSRLLQQTEPGRIVPSL